MHKLVLVVLAFASVFAAVPRRHFETGKLLDIASSERIVGGTVYPSAQFTIQVGDLIYTARGGRIKARTKDVGHGLIVGDSVQAAIDGEHLIILKPDGKEMKTTIVKRTRAVMP